MVNKYTFMIQNEYFPKLYCYVTFDSKINHKEIKYIIKKHDVQSIIDTIFNQEIGIVRDNSTLSYQDLNMFFTYIEDIIMDEIAEVYIRPIKVDIQNV